MYVHYWQTREEIDIFWQYVRALTRAVCVSPCVGDMEGLVRVTSPRGQRAVAEGASSHLPHPSPGLLLCQT